MTQYPQHHARGDHVRVLSGWMAGREAIVRESAGSDTHPTYALFVHGGGECAWFSHSNLELIERNRFDLRDRWKDERDAEIKLKSSLDWIFANAQEVLTEPHGASVQALADCLGFGDLWGRRGEGIAYAKNHALTMTLAEPFLFTGDRSGWDQFCQTFKQPNPPKGTE